MSKPPATDRKGLPTDLPVLMSNPADEFTEDEDISLVMSKEEDLFFSHQKEKQVNGSTVSAAFTTPRGQKVPFHAVTPGSSGQKAPVRTDEDTFVCPGVDDVPLFAVFDGKFVVGLDYFFQFIFIGC